MSRWQITVTVTVDDEALAEHDQDVKPPPHDVEEWYGGDLIAAYELGIAEIDHAECDSIERLPDDV